VTNAQSKHLTCPRRHDSLLPTALALWRWRTPSAVAEPNANKATRRGMTEAAASPHASIGIPYHTRPYHRTPCSTLTHSGTHRCPTQSPPVQSPHQTKATQPAPHRCRHPTEVSLSLHPAFPTYPPSLTCDSRALQARAPVSHPNSCKWRVANATRTAHMNNLDGAHAAVKKLHACT
jgi:hypothetical protein